MESFSERRTFIPSYRNLGDGIFIDLGPDESTIINMLKIKQSHFVLTAVLLGFTAVIIILLKEQQQSRHLLSTYEAEQEYIVQRVELMDSERSLRVRSLGKRLDINYAKIRSIGGNTMLGDTSSILVIAAPEYMTYSNNTIFQFYPKKYQETIAIIVSSPDPVFAGTIFHSTSHSVPIYVDADLQFSQQLDLAQNETVVLLRDRSGVVLYTYIVEEGNQLNDAEQSEILCNYLTSIK